MKNCTDAEISKLQDNLLLIRKAGGWSAEEFGNLIGVTKQTVSNLENKKTPMSKAQYIAIRTVLDYEISERKDDEVFASTVNLCLNSENLPDAEVKKAQAFVEGASKTGLEKAVFIAGLTTLIGSAAVLALRSSSDTGSWLSKLLKGDK